MNKYPIFYDYKKIRWKIFIGIVLVVSAFVSTVAGITVSNLLISTTLPSLGLAPVTYQDVSDQLNQSTLSAPAPNQILGTQFNTLTSVNNTDQKVTAFYVNWDAKSFFSLKQNIYKIDNLIPEWIQLKDITGAISLNDKTKQNEIVKYVNATNPQTQIIPLINNFNAETQNWDDVTLGGVLYNSTSRQILIENLLSYISSNKFPGITIDFENINPVDQANFIVFMQELYAKFTEANLKVYVAIPLNDPTFNYAAVAQASDYVILMGYDQNYSGSLAGPIASQQWFYDSLRLHSNDIPKEKLIVAIGNYGYNWSNTTTAEETSFQDIMQISRDSKNAINLDRASLNPYINYFDKNNIAHTIWYLDAISAFNQVVAAQQLTPSGFALYRLGSEDPSVWKVMSNLNKLDAETANQLADIETSYGINYSGSGPVLKVVATPQKGSREIVFDAASHLITSEKINNFSSSYIISKWGGTDQKKIALTFDDGPSQYTPQILDILNKFNVKATFFVVGSQAVINQPLLKKIIASGNEIGNHTFTHPDISKINDLQLKLELNSTSKFLENNLGYKTIYFRPPYNIDSEPQTEQEIKSILTTSEMGYYTVGIDIDPQDWAVNTTSGIIYSQIMSQLESEAGSVILLHDGGGNREATVEALPSIINDLQTKGYEFVTMSDLLGSNIDHNANAQKTFKSQLVNYSTILAFGGYSSFLDILKGIFIFGTIAGITRLSTIFVLSFVQYFSRKHKKYDKSYQPPVSILIPGHNEEKVIVASVEHALLSTYSKFEVIVIDDGSSDKTYKVALEHFKNNPRVRVFTKLRGGKSDALNYGIEKSRYDIVIVQDADTLMAPDALEYLVRHFYDPKVGAVAGNVKVGNRINVLTKLQAVEYITNQNMDRRAFDLLSCITIVPGAISAWRKEYVAKLGGFDSDTLAEDAELTIRMLKANYLIENEDLAIGYTEAPDNISGFLRQRFRWMFGVLQCLYKHSDMFFSPKYGFVGLLSLPYIMLYQIVFPVLAPFVDLYSILSILYVIMTRNYHPSFSITAFFPVIFSYVVFLAADLFVALEAFLLERNDNLRLIGWVFVQKIFYRPILYFVAIKTLIIAIKGPVVEWGISKRKATSKAY